MCDDRCGAGSVFWCGDGVMCCVWMLCCVVECALVWCAMVCCDVWKCADGVTVCVYELCVVCDMCVMCVSVARARMRVRFAFVSVWCV